MKNIQKKTNTRRNDVNFESFQAGDIFALFGVDCASGDTFVVDQKLTNLSCESMYVPEPVVSMSITPKDLKDRERFAKAIDRFTREDPTFQYFFDTDSKESIVSGKFHKIFKLKRAFV